MKTKINKKKKPSDVRSHNDRKEAFQEFYSLNEVEANKAIEVLDKNLKRGYTITASNEFGEELTRQAIRLIKMGKTKNPLVFNFLLELALKTENHVVAAQKGIKNKLTN